MSKFGMVPVGDIILIESACILCSYGKPNVITTVYVSRALHQLGQLTGELTWSTWRCAVVILLLAIY